MEFCAANNTVANATKVVVAILMVWAWIYLILLLYSRLMRQI